MPLRCRRLGPGRRRETQWTAPRRCGESGAEVGSGRPRGVPRTGCRLAGSRTSRTLYDGRAVPRRPRVPSAPLAAGPPSLPLPLRRLRPLPALLRPASLWGDGPGGSEPLGMRWQRLGGRAPPGRCPPGPRRPCLQRGPGGRGANVRTGLLGRVKQPRHLEPLQHPPAAGGAAPGDGAMAERRGGRPSLRSLPPVMLAIAWSGPAAYVALSGASLHLPHPPGVQPRARQMALGARCQGI